MTTSIIIAVCILMLIAYLFDLSTAKTKIPSVILLLLLGWVDAARLLFFRVVTTPDFESLLPVIGNIGLLLIVLEGSLELEFDRSKIPLVKKSFYSSIIPIILLTLILTALFSYYGNNDWRASLLSSIPLCVISSAIAIPTVRYFDKASREFVVYESSFSDIIGVLFFNFIIYNEVIDVFSFLDFGKEILVMLVLSFVFTILLAYLLNKIENHVKFTPMIIIIIMIYFISKYLHLPGLLFILILGLFLGNLERLDSVKWIHKLNPEMLHNEAMRLKEIVIEATFLVRAFFFLLFGFLLETKEILNLQTLPWSLSIFGLIVLIRFMVLKILKIPISPVGFIAPRGLITILLFLSLPASQAIGIVNKSLIVQVIIFTSLFMMVGAIKSGKIDNSSEENIEEQLQG
jgi:cell volume regulation protein A